MPTNHRRGPCRYCSKPVGHRKGRAERSPTTGIWLVWHERCYPTPHLVTGRESSRDRKPQPEPPPRKPYYLDDEE